MTKWTLLGLISLLLWSPVTLADGEGWEGHMIDANLAFERGNYGEAGRYLTVAIGEAERAGELNKGFVERLVDLADIYAGQGDFNKAQGLFMRGLAILKRLPDVDNRDIAAYLNNLAALYRAKAGYLKNLAAIDRN